MTVLAVGVAEAGTDHLYAYNWANGNFEWNDDNETTFGTDGHAVIDPDGNVYVLDVGREYLLKFNNQGVEQWQVESGSLGAQTPGRAISCNSNWVVIARRSFGAGDDDVAFFDPSDGTEVDNYTGGTDPRCVQIDADDWLAIGYENGEVRRVRRNSQGDFSDIWTVSAGSSTQRDVAITAPGSAGDVWVTGDSARVYKLAAADGDELVNESLPGTSTTGRGYGIDVDDRGYVVVTTRGAGTRALDDTGNTRWTVNPTSNRGFGVCAHPQGDWLVAWGNTLDLEATPPEFSIARLDDTDGSVVWDNAPSRLHGCTLSPGRLASFPEDWDVSLPEPPWTLTVNTQGEGSVDVEDDGTPVDPTTHDWDDNDHATLTATADSGWQVATPLWTGNVPSVDQDENPLTLVMDQDRTVTANFIEETEPTDTPANLAASTAISVQLTWDTVAGADSYDIRRNNLTIETGLTSTSFRDDTVTPGIQYTYQVRADDDGIKSDWSEPVSITPTAASADTVRRIRWDGSWIP